MGSISGTASSLKALAFVAALEGMSFEEVLIVGVAGYVCLVGLSAIPI